MSGGGDSSGDSPGRRTRADDAPLVVAAVYDELRRIARRELRARRAGETLNTTALVHEAFLKLIDHGHASWNDRIHVVALAAIAMRQILIDHARARRSEKRGGRVTRVSLDEGAIGVDDAAEALLELDDALARLAGLDARMARVVELRFFGGMTEPEIAELLGVTERTVRRDWTKAKGWLHAQFAA